MFTKVIAFAGVVAVALALPRPDADAQYGPPAPHQQDPYKKPHYEEEKRPYTFDYGVSDAYTGAQYGHQEQSDGKAIQGSYSVALPDGRVQHVKYIADHNTGFNAEVTYEGEAQYPEHKPTDKYAPPPQYTKQIPYASQPKVSVYRPKAQEVESFDLQQQEAY